MFVSDLNDDPFRNQFVVGIYGGAGVGKTELVLDLARGRQFVYLLSIDRGTARARRDPARFKGRLLTAYMLPMPEEVAEDAGLGRAPSFTRTVYRRIVSIVDERVPLLLAKGVPAASIWIVVDTISHLQTRLLHEGQEAQIAAAQVMTFRANAKGKESKLPEHVQSELLMQPEWGANLAVMTGISDYLMRSPVNLVFIFMEKVDRTPNQTPKAMPAIQGASYQRYTGDVDVLLHMTAEVDGSRVLRTRPTPKWEAKDRFGTLPEKIECKRLEDGGVVPALCQIRSLAFGEQMPAIVEG